MSEKKDGSNPESLKSLFAKDSVLTASYGASINQKWGQPASAELIAKAKTTLEGLKHTVIVVDDAAGALKAAVGKLSKSKTIGVAGSTTLSDIGFTDYLKANPTAVAKNFKADAVAAQAKGDNAGTAKAYKDGCSADVFFTSVDAISADGHILVADLTGSRTGGFLGAGEVVIVAGSQKLVPTLQDAHARQSDYCLPLESARVRVAYAAYGVKGSALNNKVVISNSNPFGAARFTIIIVKGTPVGY